METGLDSLLSKGKDKDGKLPRRLSTILFIYNCVLAALHFGQVIVALYLIISNATLYDYEMPVTVMRYTFHDRVLKRWEHVWFTYKYVLIPPLILLFTACYHVLYATYPPYSDLVAEGNQYIRWIEYLSSGFTMWLVSQAFGVVDINTLTLVVVINSCVMYLGYLNENGVKYAFWFGCTFGLASWTPTINAIIWSNAGDAPWWVWFVTLGYLVCYWCFPIVAYAFNGKSPMSRFNREIGYLSLSGIAKSLFMWTLIGVGLGPGFNVKEKLVPTRSPAIKPKWKSSSATRSSTVSASTSASPIATPPTDISTRTTSPIWTYSVSTTACPSTTSTPSNTASVTLSTSAPYTPTPTTLGTFTQTPSDSYSPLPSATSTSTNQRPLAPYTTIFGFASNDWPGPPSSESLYSAISVMDMNSGYNEYNSSVPFDYKFKDCLAPAGVYNDLAVVFITACWAGSQRHDPAYDGPIGYFGGGYTQNRIDAMARDVFLNVPYVYKLNGTSIGNVDDVATYCSTHDIFGATGGVGYQVEIVSPTIPVIFMNNITTPPDNVC